ncbi:MAG: phosphoribosylformylglycinamidine cyclo-ligase [Thermomicrobiales bacterium]|nr:phosphoribosylformylglycinamidine cyclo-ligase [Thermomicrobiales bacterium]
MSHERGVSISYRDAGVDIDAGDAVVAGLRAASGGRPHPNVIGGLGHFGGFYRLGEQGQGATLVSSIDGVGTKLVLASIADKLDGIGADLVNHCVNDIAACGASPLFFLDYYGTGKLNPESALVVIGGLADACAQLGVALVGGETAEMPGLYHGEDFDLVGAIVGLVDAAQIVDGSRIAEGDVILGLPSSGFHTNGFSLVRAALRIADDEQTRESLAQPAPFDDARTLAEALLEPHRSYLDATRGLVGAGLPVGMAHITGGGLPGNVSRVIPDGLVAEIDADAWVTPPMFEFVVEAGHVAADESYRAFNMGIGYVVVCRETDVAAARTLVPDAIEIGRIRSGDGGCRLLNVS